jgi:hypothetical protein
MHRGPPSGDPRQQAVSNTPTLRPPKELTLDSSGKIRAFAESAPAKAAASSGPNSVLIHQAPRALVPRLPGGRSVLTAPSRASRMNNQCSTRKHGRPATHAVTRGAGAP